MTRGGHRCYAGHAGESMAWHLKTLGWWLLVATAAAQTQAPASPPPTPCLDVTVKPAIAEKPPGLINRAGRMLGVAPGQRPTTAQNICPLSAGQKADIWLRKSYSPMNLVVAAFEAAVWQATQPRPEGGFGQGWDAYGSRFGASLANTESTRFFQSLVLPVLLREDTRYFREARGRIGHRFAYAISRVLVTRSDSGRRRFNTSAVAGAFMAAGLTNAYYPDADRNVPRTMRAAGFNLASSAGWNLLYEFGPDILRKLGKK